MNENINLTEILKNVPKGTKLWSPLCGECNFVNINYDSTYPITVSSNKSDFITFTEEGFYRIDGVECLLFPSKENRNWQTFKVPSKHKYFNTFQKVLVVCNDINSDDIWMADFYSHYKDGKHYTTIYSGILGISDDDILPYEGNEDKVGKSVK